MSFPVGEHRMHWRLQSDEGVHFEDLRTDSMILICRSSGTSTEMLAMSEWQETGASGSG